MLCPHWQCEICVIVQCNKPKWVCNNVRKWIKNKWNVGVVGWVNNQAFTTKLAQDWNPVHITFKGTSTKNVENFCSCKQNSSKNNVNEDTTIT